MPKKKSNSTAPCTKELVGKQLAIDLIKSLNNSVKNGQAPLLKMQYEFT